MPLHPGARGLEDDCAVLETGGETLVITHDMMAEGTHFPVGAHMADVAWKLVAVNLSDLAAKGAEPVGVLLGYSLGEEDERFLTGLHEACQAFEVPILGGDTIRGQGARSFGLTAIGRATHVPVPSRSGAQPGDAVYVTGTLGRAMLGFEGDAAHAGAYARPRPLIDEGRALAPHVSAMMDISDGLLLDASRMAQASSASIDICSAAVPVADETCRLQCMSWGDDYQLLFTLPPEQDCPVEAARIGQVGAADGDALLLDGKPLPPDISLGYQHQGQDPDPA